MTRRPRIRRLPLAWSDKHGVYIMPAAPAKPPLKVVAWDTAKGMLLIPGLVGMGFRVGLGLVGWAIVFAVFGYAPRVAAWLLALIAGWL